jgi:hypothetical protein
MVIAGYGSTGGTSFGRTASRVIERMILTRLRRLQAVRDRLRRATIAAGVPAGTNTPNHGSMTNSLMAGLLKGRTGRPRNGFVYTMERANGAMVGAKPHVDNDNWTKGICAYSGLGDPTSADPIKKVCPNR